MWVKVKNLLINCARITDFDIMGNDDLADVQIIFCNGNVTWVDDFLSVESANDFIAELWTKVEHRKNNGMFFWWLISLEGKSIDPDYVDYFFIDNNDGVRIFARKDKRYILMQVADNHDAALDELDKLEKTLNGGNENVA